MPPTGARPFWDYPRSPAATRNLVDAARDRGFGPDACLEGTGITEADLTAPDAVITGVQELRVVRNLLALTKDPAGLGIEVGTRYQLASAGILGFALLSSPTMGEALSVGLRFSQLSSTFHHFTLKVGETDSTFDLDDNDVPTDVRQFLLERDLMAIAGIVPILFGGAMPAGARIMLRTGPQTPLRLLAELLTVEFDSPRNALVFPTALLAEPLPTADPHTAALCVRQCEELLELRRAAASRARYATNCSGSRVTYPPWVRSPRACTSANALCIGGSHAKARHTGHYSTKYVKPSPGNSSGMGSRCGRCPIDWATPNPRRLPMHIPVGGACHRARGKFGGVTETPPETREIDYRFTLANERTFLSWIRTALGLLAGGVAVQTLVQPFHHAGVRHALAASCLALAVVVSIGAYVHWRDVKNRMDRAQPLKGTMLVPLLAISIGLVAILASVAVFYR